MDENIVEHFSKKLLQNPRRIMGEEYEIKEIYNQPERSKREDFDKYYGTRAEIKEDGLCYFEDGRIIDLNQPIEDAVL